MVEPLTKEWIKLNSQKESCSFSDLLRRLAIDDLLYLLLEKEDKIRFILLNNNLYEEKPIGFFFKEIMEQAINEIKKSLALESEFRWEVVESETIDDCSSRLYLMAWMEDMKIPVTIELFEKKNEPIFQDLKVYRGYRKRIDLEYRVCAPEQKLSECIYMILNRLELISSMEFYDEAYSIIKNYSVDGRRVTEEVSKLWKSNRFEEKTLGTLKGYETYKYMQKRWDSYRKNKAFQTKIPQEISWQEVLGTLCTFIEPMFLCLCKDEVFIGDWMPELGRFM